MIAKKQSWISTLAMVLVALATVFAIAEDASAQSKKASTKKKTFKDSANKKGMDVLATKEFDGNQLPGTKQYIIAFGSLAGAVAAIKYL